MDKGKDVFVEEEEIDNGIPQIMSETPKKWPILFQKQPCKNLHQQHLKGSIKPALHRCRKCGTTQWLIRAPIERFPTKIQQEGA